MANEWGLTETLITVFAIVAGAALGLLIVFCFARWWRLTNRDSIRAAAVRKARALHHRESHSRLTHRRSTHGGGPRRDAATSVSSSLGEDLEGVIVPINPHPSEVPPGIQVGKREPGLTIDIPV
jgi:hypothetical protein